jgi:RNA polymerase primary sigma factor
LQTNQIQSPPAKKPEPSESAHLYGRANRQPLLGREGERALSIEIEKRSRALWKALLADRETAELAAARLPGATMAPRELHAIDEDHLVADELVARSGGRVPAIAAAARAVADARNRFVQANIGLVLHVAGRYRSTSLSFGDFVQEGMLGLIKAVDRFDHRRGLRFSTYATWWIRHAMGRALADKNQLVRVPVHVQDARQRLEVVARTLRKELAREPDVEELARAAGVSREQVVRIRETAVIREVRLDAPIGDDGDQNRADVFVDPTDQGPRAEDELDLQALAGAAQRHMQGLSEMEREVLRRRFGLDGLDHEATFQEIANDHGLSRERIRQIQESALGKLRTRLARQSCSSMNA